MSKKNGEVSAMAERAIRKERLQALEGQIVKAAEEIQKNGLEIGRDLCAIRDEGLWEDDYESWSQYLKDRAEELVGKSFAQASKLMQAAQISSRLPDKTILDGEKGLTPSHINELGRLAPTVGRPDGQGVEKDYSRIKTNDVKRVLKRATAIAEGEAPSVREIRKAVDEELGIDRTAQAKATKAKREEAEEAAAQPELHRFLGDVTVDIDVAVKKLETVADNADAWKVMRELHPGVMKRFIAACDSLVDLKRRIEG